MVPRDVEHLPAPAPWRGRSSRGRGLSGPLRPARAEAGATRRAVSVCLPAAAAAAVLLMASCYSAAGHRIAFVEGPLG